MDLWKNVFYFPKDTDNLGTEPLPGVLTALVNIDGNRHEIFVGPLPGSLVVAVGDDFIRLDDVEYDGAQGDGYWDFAENVSFAKSGKVVKPGEKDE